MDIDNHGNNDGSDDEDDVNHDSSSGNGGMNHHNTTNDESHRSPTLLRTSMQDEKERLGPANKDASIPI